MNCHINKIIFQYVFFLSFNLYILNVVSSAESLAYHDVEISHNYNLLFLQGWLLMLFKSTYLKLTLFKVLSKDIRIIISIVPETLTLDMV